MVYSISYWPWGVEEGHFRRRNQSTTPKTLLSATLGEVLVQKGSHQSYQGYLFHQIIHILSLSSLFGVSIPSHLSRSGYTTAPDLALAPSPAPAPDPSPATDTAPAPVPAPAPAHLSPQPHYPLKRAEKCP